MPGFGQFTTGIMPLPGTPAYETMLQRVANAQPIGNPNAIADARLQAANAFQALKAGGGQTYGIFGKAGTGSAGLAGTSASAGGGAGADDLTNEILGIVRSAPNVQDEAARRRFNEDIAQARTEKTRDLARRGLFQAGTGEMELQRDIDKPYTRGLADLEANMADENARLALGKAAVLGNIEAQQRHAQAMALAQGASAGTGAYNPFGGGGGGPFGGKSAGQWTQADYNATNPGIFGAQFTARGPSPPPGTSAPRSTAPPPGQSGPDLGPDYSQHGPGELSAQQASNLLQMGLTSQNRWTRGIGGGYVYSPQ